MKSYLKLRSDPTMAYPYRIYGEQYGEVTEALLILRECEVALNIKIRYDEPYEILDTRIKNRRGFLRGDSLISLRPTSTNFLKIDVNVKNVEKIYFILKKKSTDI